MPVSHLIAAHLNYTARAKAVSIRNPSRACIKTASILVKPVTPPFRISPTRLISSVRLSLSIAILAYMDHLWTPWRYRYVTGAEQKEREDHRLGVPPALSQYYSADQHCVFCNLLGAVETAIAKGVPTEQAQRAALFIQGYEHCFICLNAYPYSTGHIMIVPYCHKDSLSGMETKAAQEMMHLAQFADQALRSTYSPDGLNFGLNLGRAAGAGVAEHLHLHALPRWLGDTNFMTATAETRVLPETLDITWEKLRQAFA